MRIFRNGLLISGQQGANPVSYYYGKDQTERVGGNYTPSGQGNDRAAEHKTTADEVYNGGKSNLLTITNPSDESNIDIAKGPNNCVIQFPAGRYHLLFQGYNESGGQSGFRVELKRIQAQTDDLVITHTTGRTRGASPAQTAYQLIWTDFVVDGTEKFYLLFPVSGRSNRSHFLRIEKIV